MSLQCKCGTGPVEPVGFIEVDNAFFHDLVDLIFGDVAAVHPAQSMSCVINMRRMAVECFPAFWFLPACNDKKHQENKDDDQAICGGFCFQRGEDNVEGSNWEVGVRSVSRQDARDARAQCPKCSMVLTISNSSIKKPGEK